jgi:subtilisin family serine protease
MNAVSEANRAAAEILATAAPSDVVMVKLKPDAARDIAVSRSVRGALALSRPLDRLTQLLERRIVSEVTPVFPLDQGEVVRGLMSADARTTSRRAVRAARAPEVPRRARNLISLKVGPGTDAAQLARDLNRDPAVEYAYVPAVKHPTAAGRRSASRKKAKRTGPDPLSARQWSHGAVRIHEARKLRGFREAADVLVAIVDSGIDQGHPDLAGVVDSFTNFLAPSEDDRDYRGHGTHVAGIISAVINNAVGIAGLCKARLAVLKALPRRGGRWNPNAYYQALAKPIELEARVVNLSLGGPLDPGEKDIILDLLDEGIVVVAAMGNEYEEGNPKSYPAAYDGVIAVGASDEVDRRAAFSCTGRHIALVAPGERILSTVPRYESEFAATTLYDSWPGTSMATPHVAAAAALLLAKNPRLTPAQVRKRLCNTADKTQWQTKRPSDQYGWGRLNVARALR